MSVNRFMHPRNIYKTPPDFNQLAIDYEEFRRISKMVCFFFFDFWIKFDQGAG